MSAMAAGVRGLMAELGDPGTEVDETWRFWNGRLGRTRDVREEWALVLEEAVGTEEEEEEEDEEEARVEEEERANGSLAPTGKDGLT